MSVSQLSDYRIILVGTEHNVYCIDNIKNPKWYQVNSSELIKVQKIKQTGFSSILVNYTNDRVSCFKFIPNNGNNKDITSSSIIQFDSRCDSAIPFYNAWITTILRLGDNANLYRGYFPYATAKKTEGNFGRSFWDFFWFDNQRLKSQTLISYNIDIPITNGLVGYYNNDSFVDGYWFDLTSNNNNVVYLSNNIEKSSNYIYGDSKSFVIFPTQILPPEYTVFHICKYNSKTKGRILQGLKNNWLSGFHNSNSGLAYHGEWITQSSNIFGDQWILSTDQNSLYRSNMHDLTIKNPTAKESAQLAINIGNQPSEKSDWACACIIVFDRKLSIQEIETVETWLISKYQNLFTNTMKNLGFDNFYSIDPNDQSKKTIGKILDDNLETSLYNIKQVKFICPSFDSSNCLNCTNTDFTNMKQYGNQIPVLHGLKEIQCEAEYNTNEQNLADSFKFIDNSTSISSESCKNIFDTYNLYPTTNNLAIVNPSINSNLINTIDNHDQLIELASQYSGSFTNINTDDAIKSSINKVLENAPLKAVCCRRIPTDNTQKSAKIFTSLSPSVNSANKTLSNLD